MQLRLFGWLINRSVGWKPAEHEGAHKDGCSGNTSAWQNINGKSMAPCAAKDYYSKRNSIENA